MLAPPSRSGLPLRPLYPLMMRDNVSAPPHTHLSILDPSQVGAINAAASVNNALSEADGMGGAQSTGAAQGRRDTDALLLAVDVSSLRGDDEV